MSKSGNGGGGGRTPTYVKGVTTISSSQFFERAWPGLSTIFRETKKNHPRLPISFRDVFETSTPTTQCKTAIGPCLPQGTKLKNGTTEQGCKCWICGAPIYIKKDGTEFLVPKGTSESQANALLQQAVKSGEMAETIKSPHCEHQIPVLPATIILGGLIEAKTFETLKTDYPGIAKAIIDNYSYSHGEENMFKKNDPFINDDGSINEENMMKVLETVFWTRPTVQGSEVDSIKKYLARSYPGIWKNKRIFRKWMADRVLAMTSTLEPSIKFYTGNRLRGAELDVLAGTALAITKLGEYIDAVGALSQKPGPNQAGYQEFYEKLISYQPEQIPFLKDQPGRGVGSPYILDPSLLEDPKELERRIEDIISIQYLLTGPFVNAIIKFPTRSRYLDTQIPIFFNQLFHLTGDNELLEKTDTGRITRKIINFVDISKYLKNLLEKNQDIIGIAKILDDIKVIALLAGGGNSQEVLAKFKFGYIEAISAARALMLVVNEFIKLKEQEDFRDIDEQLNLILYGSETVKPIKYKRVENGFLVDQDETMYVSEPSLLKNLYQTLTHLYSTYRIDPIEDETKQPILCLTTLLLNETAESLSGNTLNLPNFLTELFKGQEPYLRDFPLEIMLQTEEVVKLDPLEIQIRERMPGGTFGCETSGSIQIEKPSELGDARQDTVSKIDQINAMLLKADETRAARREEASQKIQETWKNYIERRRSIAELQQRRLEIAIAEIESKPTEVVATETAQILQAMLKDQEEDQQRQEPDQLYLHQKKPVVVENLPPFSPRELYMRGRKFDPTLPRTIEGKLFKKSSRSGNRRFGPPPRPPRFPSRPKEELSQREIDEIKKSLSEIQSSPKISDKVKQSMENIKTSNLFGTGSLGGKINKKTRRKKPRRKKPRSIKKKIRKSRKRTVRKYKKK